VDDERLRTFARTFGALQQLERSLATGRRELVADDPHFPHAVETELTNFGVRLPDDYAPLTDTEGADLKAGIELRQGSNQTDGD
jgi:hypothetical protein